MNNRLARHFLGVTLFGLLLLSSWVAAPVHSTTATTPTGIPRLSFAITCGSGEDCNQLRVLVIAPEACHAPPATFRFEVRGGQGPFEVSVKGPDGNSVDPLFTMNDGSEGTFEGILAGRYEVNVIDNNRCEAGCFNSTVPCCTITQNDYSNNQFGFNGMGILAILDELITPPPQPNQRGFGPLTVGFRGIGTRSLTFEEGSEGCIILRLPATGSPTVLPAGFSEIINPSTCQTSPPLPLENNKFLNALLGQAIALSLNTRRDFDLGGLNICNTMRTRKALSREPNGKVGEYISTIDLETNTRLRDSTDALDTAAPIQVVTIPTTVTAALANLGLQRTVNNLVILANRALAGDSNLGGASLCDISIAISAINTAFDRCTFLTGCVDFDLCLQDSGGDVLSLNSVTGDYQFSRCGPAGFIISGRGTVTRQSQTLYLKHNAPDRRVSAQFNTSRRSGIASVEVLSLWTTFTLTDRNTTDNNCICSRGAECN